MAKHAKDESKWFEDFSGRCIAHIKDKEKTGHPDYMPGQRIPLYILENAFLDEFVSHFDLPADFVEWLGGFGLLGRGIAAAKKQLAAAKRKHNEHNPVRLAQKRFKALKKAADVIVEELGNDSWLRDILEQMPHEPPAELVTYRARHMIASWQNMRDFHDNDPDDWPPIVSPGKRFRILAGEASWLVDQINEALAALKAGEIEPPAELPRLNDPDLARFCGNARDYWTEILEREPVIGKQDYGRMSPLVAFTMAAWLLVNGKSLTLDATRRRLREAGGKPCCVRDARLCHKQRLLL